MDRTQPAQRWRDRCFDTTKSAIISYSGKGPNQDATAEAGHVSVWIWIGTGQAQQGEFFYTDLSCRTVKGTFGNTEYAFIKVLTEAEAKALTVSVEKLGIYRIWELEHQNARTALAYARLKTAKYNEANAAVGKGAQRKYSKFFSNAYTRSWNCATYAEKVIRANGINVNAGYFVSSPLEMTTGGAARMREKNAKKNGRDWFWSPRPQQ